MQPVCQETTSRLLPQRLLVVTRRPRWKVSATREVGPRLSTARTWRRRSEGTCSPLSQFSLSTGLQEGKLLRRLGGGPVRGPERVRGEATPLERSSHPPREPGLRAGNGRSPRVRIVSEIPRGGPSCPFSSTMDVCTSDRFLASPDSTWFSRLAPHPHSPGSLGPPGGRPRRLHQLDILFFIYFFKVYFYSF